MTDYTKPVSSSNPPESKGIRREQVVEAPIVDDKAAKKLLPRDGEDETPVEADNTTKNAKVETETPSAKKRTTK